ncbi:GLPGLI family protein [Proteiniphilum sp.]|uniref:GLPGLI family protein n=1 Tax=Proteiniphilum sp. TaxID=1926877 RepID=UPI0033293CB0
MKQISILCFLFLFGLGAFSQNEKLDESVLECHYKLVMQKDTVRKSDLVEDDMVLRVGRTTSQFFSRYTFYHDSLWADPEGIKIAQDLSLEALMSPDPSRVFGARTTKDYLYKNYPEGKMTIYAKDFIHVNFFYEENYIPQEWIVRDSTKQILGYDCKKAECEFRGRHWITWFAVDIPIKNGPWKLNGLPGLILEAYDSKMDYHYTATRIDEKPVSPVILYKFEDNQEMKTERKIYNYTLQKFMTGAPAEELELIQEALKKGIPLKYVQRSPRRLLYDFLERDHLTP